MQHAALRGKPERLGLCHGLAALGGAHPRDTERPWRWPQPEGERGRCTKLLGFQRGFSFRSMGTEARLRSALVGLPQMTRCAGWAACLTNK